MLLVQSVLIKWTKSEESERRLAVPEVLPIPATRTPVYGQRWLHSVQADERSRFEIFDWLEVVEGSAPLEVPTDFPVVEIRSSEDTVQVRRADVPVAALSQLTQADAAPLFELRLGETAQVRIQAARSSYSHHWFERQTVNIAWLEEYDGRIFTERPFDRRFDELPALDGAASVSYTPKYDSEPFS